jgi:hypothetical protein
MAERDVKLMIDSRVSDRRSLPQAASSYSLKRKMAGI